VRLRWARLHIVTNHKRPRHRGVIGPVLASLTTLVLIAGIGWFVLNETASRLVSRDEPLTTVTNDASATPPRRATPSYTPRRTTASATPTRSKSVTPTPRRTSTAPSRSGTRTTKPTRSSTPKTTSPTTTTPVGGTAEAQVLQLTNNERAKAGCGPLRMNSALTRAAEAHAADMVDHHYFSHDSLDGTNPFDRMRAAGYTGGAMAENIGVGYKTAAAVVEGWMNSAGHRRNILNCTYTVIGIGYDAGQVTPEWGNGSWVQDFGG
jgi:uncharacterized protein YkwD